MNSRIPPNYQDLLSLTEKEREALISFRLLSEEEKDKVLSI